MKKQMPMAYRIAMPLRSIFLLTTILLTCIKPLHAQTPTLTNLNSSPSSQPRIKNVITGTVRNADGQFLQHAEILVNEKVITTTNKDGYFEIDPDQYSAPFVFQVMFPKLVTVARNYHPVMNAANYNIVLCQPCIKMLPPPIPDLEIICEGKQSELTNDIKEQLSLFAEILRNHPGTEIDIIGSFDKKKKTPCRELHEKIKTYLQDEEGINDQRMHIIQDQNQVPGKFIIKVTKE